MAQAASRAYLWLEGIALSVLGWLIGLVRGSRPEDMEPYRQFVRFCAVGVLNTLIGWGVYYIFIFINVEYYLIGNAVGFVAGVLNSYFWNRRYVFKIQNDRRAYTLAKTFASYGFTLVLTTALLYLMVDMLHMSAFLAPLVCMLLTIPVNFLLNKFWAYRERPAGPSD